MTFIRACARLAFFVASGLALILGAWALDAATAVAAFFVLSRRRGDDLRVANRRAKNAFLRAVAYGLAGACGVRVHLDAEAERLVRHGGRRPCLHLANHVSYLDIVVLGSFLRCCFLGKKEVASWPILGWAGRSLGMEFVDRGSVGARAAALLRLKRRLRDEGVVVFPEGSTTRDVAPDGSLWHAGQLWSADSRANRVICYGISYGDQQEAAWVEDMEFVPHLWRFLMRAETTVFVCARELRFPAHGPADIRARSREALSCVRELCLKARKKVVESQQRRTPEANGFTAEEVSACKPSS